MITHSEALKRLHDLKIRDAQSHRGTNVKGGTFGGHTYTVESVRRELGLDEADFSDVDIANLITEDADWHVDDNIKKANALQVTNANRALADSQRQLDAARNAAARVVTPPLFTPLVVKPNIFTDPYYGYRPIVQAPIVHKHYARARSPVASDRKEKERKERERSRERLQREKEKLQREREKAKEKLQRERDRSRERMKKEKTRNKK